MGLKLEGQWETKAEGRVRRSSCKGLVIRSAGSYTEKVRAEIREAEKEDEEVMA